MFSFFKNKAALALAQPVIIKPETIAKYVIMRGPAPDRCQGMKSKGRFAVRIEKKMNKKNSIRKYFI